MNTASTPPLILQRTDARHPGFRTLVRQLDAALSELNGTADGFYQQFNGLEHIQHVIIAQSNGTTLGCGAMKELAVDTMEVKRMFVSPEARGQGIAKGVLAALEEWAGELGCRCMQLETGTNNPEAIGLYTRCGYSIIPNFGQYAGVAGSVCFQKML
ncbi:MAG: GNAT family N-acetyltransferase [Chitinophagaceae bacterium]|nr:MAG: GNAT family N-acetyltransferase [Chitinophagaceae bacterium]